jgi:hypothetical protein
MVSDRFYTETTKRQDSYQVSNTCTVSINLGEIERKYIKGWDGTIITAFPIDTPERDIHEVCRILNGIISTKKFFASAEFIRGHGGYQGEPVLIPGIVVEKDGVPTIMSVFPELRTKPTQEAHESITAVAKLLGGRVESIVFRMFYSEV